MKSRWWSVRPAQNLTSASYVCPFCDGMLQATRAHMLVTPEGDLSKRRHAHTDCVDGARKRGELTLEEEWRKRTR